MKKNLSKLLAPLYLTSSHLIKSDNHFQIQQTTEASQIQLYPIAFTLCKITSLHSFNSFKRVPMTIKTTLFLIIIICSYLSPISQAKELRMSLAILPIHSYLDSEGKPTGTLIDLVKAMDEVYTSGTFQTKQYPFPRSLDNVITGRADIHIPLIKAPNFSEKGLGYTFASQTMGVVTFVLYSRADKPPLKMDNLDKYNVTTMRGHKAYFPFDVSEDTGNAQGLGKVLRGRTDGYIIEQDTADNYIKANKLKNLRRTNYAQFDFGVVIPTGDRRQEIDSIISDIIIKLKEKGEIERIFKVINTQFVDWQPYEMPW